MSHMTSPALAQLEVAVGPQLEADLLRRGRRVERTAKRLAPVDTGRLRGSITVELVRTLAGVECQVGTTVAYARHQEFGTQYQRGTPFLRPALPSAADQPGGR